MNPHKNSQSTAQALESLVNFFVPQAVDHGINQGNQDRVEDREEFMQLSQGRDVWQHVDNDDGAIKNANHCKMRGAGQKGLLPPYLGWKFQNGDNDTTIGCDCQQKWHDREQKAKDKGGKVQWGSITAGEFCYWNTFTKEMVNLVTATEM